jgi:D-alanine-D-alanine ligase
MKTLILYTLPPEVLGAGQVVGEFDLTEAAGEVLHALPKAEVVGVRGSAREILGILESRRPDVVFNLCEAPLGRPDLESQVAALFEWEGIRFTGAGSQTLELCRRKDRTKAVLEAAGVPVPRAGVYPSIVKPADQDGSTGIFADSVCADATAQEKAVARLAGPAIVEEFLVGKEFVVSLWGQFDADHISIGEVFFQNDLRLFTYASKWDLSSCDYKNSRLHYNTQIDTTLRDALTSIARGTWRAVGARGYLRLDLRLDASGIPRVLDVNPNPEVSPETGMHRAVVEAGWSWERFVRRQVEWAVSST